MSRARETVDDLGRRRGSGSAGVRAIRRGNDEAGFRGGVAAFPSSEVANCLEIRAIWRLNDALGFSGSGGFVAVGTGGIGGGSGHTVSNKEESRGKIQCATRHVGTNIHRHFW
jgi:hypothetical protein